MSAAVRQRRRGFHAAGKSRRATRPRRAALRETRLTPDYRDLAWLQQLDVQADSLPGQPLSEQQSQRHSEQPHEPLSQQPQQGQEPQPAFESRPIPTGTADVRASADNKRKAFMTECS